jgi:hypothetical protein
VVSDIAEALLDRLVLEYLQLLLARAGRKDAGSPDEQYREIPSRVRCAIEECC